MDLTDNQWWASLTSWMILHPESILACVSLFAFLEAMFVVGLFVSSVVLVTVASAATIQGGVPIGAVVLFAFGGALLGDNLGYWLGRRTAGFGVRSKRLPARLEPTLERAERLISRFGSWAVLLGRFLPPIRSVVPFVLGVAGMDGRRYLTFDTAACLVWSLCLGLIVSGVGLFF